MSELAKLDVATKQIIAAKDRGDLDALLKIKNVAAAVKRHMDQIHASREEQNRAARVELDAIRAIGQLDALHNPNPADVGGPGRGNKTTSPTEVVLDMSSATRAAWRKIGAWPEDEYRAWLDEQLGQGCSAGSHGTLDAERGRPDTREGGLSPRHPGAVDDHTIHERSAMTPPANQEG